MAHSVNAEWWRATAAPGSGAREAAAVQGKDSPVPFWAVMVFTFVMLLAPQQTLVWLAPARIALLSGTFAVAAHCWARFAARQPLVRFTREIRLAAALLGWAVVTIPLSEWVGGSLQVLLDLFLKALLIFWLVSHTVTTLGRLSAVAWGLSLMAAPVAVTGVWHFLVHDENLNRVIGYNAPLTANPNDLALTLNLILPLTVGLLLVSRRGAVRGLLTGLIMLDASGVVVTFSRSGFLTLATSLVLYLRTLHRWRKWKWAALAFMLAAAAVPLLPSGYLERLGTITNISSDPTGSAQRRTADSLTALAFALSHPVPGAGLGMNYLVLNALRGPTWQPVHNVYLEYAVDLGWPGLGLFLLLLLSCIGRAARVRENCANVPALRELSALAEAIQVALVAFAVAGFFYPVAYHYYFYYFAALAVAASAVYEKQKPRHTMGSPASALTG